MHRVVKNSDDLIRLYSDLGNMQHPFTASIVLGEKRTNPQNSISHKWYAEIAKQRGDVTASRVRAECKLQFGARILCRDDAGFRAWFDETLRPLGWAMIVELFERLEPQVTSKMTKGQLSEYLDSMGNYYREKGFVLTDPELRKYEAAQ